MMCDPCRICPHIPLVQTPQVPGHMCSSWLHKHLPVLQDPLINLCEAAEDQPGVTCPWKVMPESDQKTRSEAPLEMRNNLVSRSHLSWCDGVDTTGLCPTGLLVGLSPRFQPHHAVHRCPLCTGCRTRVGPGAVSPCSSSGVDLSCQPAWPQTGLTCPQQTPKPLPVPPACVWLGHPLLKDPNTPIAPW